MAKRKWAPTPPTKTPAAPEAAAEEECSHGVHGPWCREYTKMQDALTRNTNNTNLLFAAVIEYTDASDVFDSIPTEFQYSDERGPYEQDVRRVITARTVLENVLCGFLPERTYTLTPMREQARKKYAAGRDALLFDLNAAKAEIASLTKRLANERELLAKAELARLRALGYPEEEAKMDSPKIPITFRIHEPGGIRRVTLGQGIIKIGRLTTSQLCIEDPSVARMHAVIEVVSPDEVYIIDLGAEHGVLQNGRLIVKARLKSGDELMIGKVRVFVMFGAQVEPEPPEEVVEPIDTCPNCLRPLYKGTDEELDCERLRRYNDSAVVHDTCASQANAECDRVRHAYRDVVRAGLVPGPERKV